MLWLVRPAVKTVVRLLPIALSMLVGMALVFLVKLRQEQQTWGVMPSDANRPLAGDDLIADPGIVDTRSLVIDAPPAAVWPWLAQLGFGRGGWYSYDRMDMAGSSADRILPQFQDLAPGDIVPTHPGGGFLAKVVEPQQALVLYLDHELVRSQAEAAAGRAWRGRPRSRRRAPARRPAGRGRHGRPDDARVPGHLVVRPGAAGGRHPDPARGALPRLDRGCRNARQAGHARDGPGRLRHDPQAHARPQGACRAPLDASRARACRDAAST